MAPLNGAAGKPAKTAARRTASKPVVPVLPLNYPQRPPAIVKPAASPAVTSPPASALPNGQTVQDQSTLRAAHQQDETSAELRREGGQGSGKNNDYVMSSTAPPAMAPSSAPGAATQTSAEKVIDTPTAAKAVPNHALASPTPTRPPAHHHASTHHRQNSDLSVHNHSGPSFPPGTGNRPHFHQHHASNGSLVFGQFHDSNASSPAPHPGVGFPAPPPGIMPFPHGTRPVPAVDAYGRPLVMSPTIDGFAPSVVSHPGPPTPHSFHGSQSPVAAEETSFSSFHSLNGHQGFPADPAAHFSPGQASAVDMHMNNGLHLTGHLGYHNPREHDELLAFLRHGAVGNDTFSDCDLEVRFPNSPQHFDHPEYQRMQPVFRAQAHRYILSRSPALAHNMRSLGIQANGGLYIEIHDEYMRPDVFGYVFRSLYGWPLGDAAMPFLSDLPPRDVRDDMQTTLSYIATARYLQLSAAYSISIMRAARLICWETIESLIAFVVPIVAVSDKNRDFSASELLEDITGFIVNQFPRDFVLDVNAVDSGFIRLPATESAQDPNAPPFARSISAGSHSRQSSNAQAHTSHPQRAPANARLSHIRFGDIALEDRNGDTTPASPADAVRSHRAPTSNETTLSRILLNLPFELLKRVLEHPHLTKRPGDENNAVLHNLINQIVAEREARRLASLKPSTQLEDFHQALENAARPLPVERIGDYLVNNMGFKEEVLEGDGPYLGRTWTGGASGSTSS